MLRFPDAGSYFQEYAARSDSHSCSELRLTATRCWGMCLMDQSGGIVTIHPTAQFPADQCNAISLKFRVRGIVKELLTQVHARNEAFLVKCRLLAVP